MTQTKISLLVEPVVCHSVTQCFWLLLHHLYWSLMGTPLGYPVVALYREEPATLDLQGRPFHTLQQFIHGVDVRMGQPSPGSRPGW